MGEDNPYGHPAPETLDRLASVNAEIYRTDLHGTVVITSDGQTLWTNQSAAPHLSFLVYLPLVQDGEDTEPTPEPGNVQITDIFYDGVVPYVESDEYAAIKNTGSSPVNLDGWRLNAGVPGGTSDSQTSRCN